MNQVKKIGLSRIAIAVIAAVIASATAAIAAGGGGSGGDQSRAPGSGPGGAGGRHMGGPGGGGRYMTYSEIHSFKNGKETVTRADAGKIKAVSESEITLTERDGNEVTVAVNEDTEVHAFAEPEASVADLKTGQQVIVARESGQPAEDIMVRPAKGQRPTRPNPEN